MNNKDDGATKVPAKPVVMDCPGAGDRTMAHKDVWVWEDGVMTDKVRCERCGRITTNHRTENGDA